MSVALVIALTLVTCGIYAPIWFLKRREFLNALDSSEKEISAGMAIAVIVLWSISMFLTVIAGYTAGVSGSKSPVDGIDGLFTLAGAIVLLTMSFRAKNRIAQHMVRAGQHVEMSGFATFFLQTYYLQYKINRLPEQVDVARHFD